MPNAGIFLSRTTRIGMKIGYAGECRGSQDERTNLSPSRTFCFIILIDRPLDPLTSYDHRTITRIVANKVLVHSSGGNDKKYSSSKSRLRNVQSSVE